MSNIEIPKLNKKMMRKMRSHKRTCRHEGCNKVFIGRCNRQFCDEHGTQYWVNRRRKRKRRIKTDPSIDNLVIKEKVKIRYVSELKCHLKGCNKHYKITVIPNQKIYRKFCDEHINPYKRELYLRNTA